MRAAFRNTIAAAVAAAIAISGADVAHAAQEIELAPVLTNTATLVDSDGDGLPDIWEEQGVVLADGTEIPLPDWGADPNRPDVFLQLNWMASEYDTLGCDTSAARECANANRTSYAPSTQSLDDLVDLFADHGISLHIDAGEHYTNIANYTEHFGGETLDYRDVYFDANRHEAFQLIDTINNLGDRANIFRPGVLGDRMRAGSNATGLSLVGDNSFYVANPGGRANDEQVRNSILHEFGHTLGLRHWGAAKYVEDIAEGSPMQAGYHSVMNYDRQFDYFNYSEKPYFADTPAGKVLVPADWDSLVLDNPRIGAYAESIGARAKAEVEEIEQPEEVVEVEQPEPVEVAEEHPLTALVPAEEIADEPAAEVEAQPGVVPAKAEQPVKDEPKVETKAEAKVKVEVKPAKAEAPKQADSQVNIAAIIGGVVAALAALGIGAAFLAMR
ncbi:zinc metalloprotease [Corynebacterium sp. CQ3829_602738]